MSATLDLEKQQEAGVQAAKSATSDATGNTSVLNKTTNYKGDVHFKSLDIQGQDGITVKVMPETGAVEISATRKLSVHGSIKYSLAQAKKEFAEDVRSMRTEASTQTGTGGKTTTGGPTGPNNEEPPEEELLQGASFTDAA